MIVANGMGSSVEGSVTPVLATRSVSFYRGVQYDPNPLQT